MTQMLADAEQAKLLEAADGPVQVVDRTGRVLGIVQPAAVAPPGVAAARSPYTVEQLRELRKQEGGVPLAEILKRLDPV